MALLAPIEDRPAPPPIHGAKPTAKSVRPIAAAPRLVPRPQLAADDLAFRVYAALRAHPHVSNVLTHISHARWIEVEHCIAAILDPATASEQLSPLGRNIVDLMVAERGITGRILKPYLHAVLHRLLDPPGAELLIRHIDALYRDLAWKLQHPPLPPAGRESIEEDRPCQN
jgi:hypothetical protein